jgi:hypothetical protein
MTSVQHLGRFVIPTLEDTGVSLGRGSYGEVVEMRMKGEKVAVKKLHPVFKDTDGWEVAQRNFEEECARCVLIVSPTNLRAFPSNSVFQIPGFL